jgi:hypothetical protein
VTALEGVLLDTLPGLVSGLLSGALGGYYAGREQVRYQLRVDAITEIRGLIIEARRALYDWVSPSVFYAGRPGDYHRVSEIGAKLDDLKIYYEKHIAWLDGQNRAAVEAVHEQLARFFTAYAEACNITDRLEEQHQVAWEAHEWLTEDLPRIEQTLQVRPWWRRVFGG